MRYCMCLRLSVLAWINEVLLVTGLIGHDQTLVAGEKKEVLRWFRVFDCKHTAVPSL